MQAGEGESGAGGGGGGGGGGDSELSKKQPSSSTSAAASAASGVASVGGGQLVSYAVGSDKTIKEISESMLLREIDLHTLVLSSISMSAESGLLFTGSTGGRVQVRSLHIFI